MTAIPPRPGDAPPPGMDWRGYYEWESGQKRFLPSEDPSEAMRVEFVLRLLKGIRVTNPLDAGCGNGYLASRLREHAGRATATDLSLGRLRDAARFFPGVIFCRASIFEQPFPDRSFDLVTAVEVVEHLEDTPRALAELRRLSSRHVLITVPWRGLLELLHCPHCQRDFYRDGHVQSFTEERLSELVAAAGMKILKLDVYVPYYPPLRPPASLLPAGLHKALRAALVATGLKEPTRPKFLGVLAERTD